MGYYDDGGMLLALSIIINLVVACVFGVVTKLINENKGYYGGFAWGFWLGWIGIIVVACKPTNYYSPRESIIVPAHNTNTRAMVLSDGSWQCRCGRHNARYVSSCVCGMNKSQIAAENTAEEVNDDEAKNISALKEYKELLDNGVITQEEFEEKKKQILSR